MSSFEYMYLVEKQDKTPKTTHCSTTDLATECFCLYILLFSTCEVFGHFISPICKIKRGLGDHCVEIDGWLAWCNTFWSEKNLRKEVVIMYCQVQSLFLFLTWGSLICMPVHLGCLCRAMWPLNECMKYVVCCSDQHSFRNSGTFLHTQVKRDSTRKYQNV